MIDFVKLEILGISPIELERNPLLAFSTQINPDTGEQIGSYSQATYKSLRFKIYDATLKNPKGRITLEGSLHKYWNNGGHNFNDFGLKDVRSSLMDLYDLFGIVTSNCYFRALEIGINILPPAPSEKIIQYCLLHKTTPLKTSYTPQEGSYIQARNQRHTIKIYDKRKHYKSRGFSIDTEILRIEKKWERMFELGKMGIHTLADLLNYGLKNFEPILLQVWDEVLFYCWETLEGTKYEANYSNPNYWLNLKSENFKYHRKRLNSLIDANPNNIKAKISAAITAKILELNAHPTQINPLGILLNQVGGRENVSSKVCKVTGLNIEMQRANSFLLSHTGLKYYAKNDRSIFNELKARYLSDKWSSSAKEVQIRELAHNIRNYWNNAHIKQRRNNPKHQLNLFAACPELSYQNNTRAHARQ